MKVGMLFPGYGSQFIGMAKELYDNSRIVQDHFEVASQCLDMNFVKLCFASSDVEIARVANAYPALFLTSVSTAFLIKEHNIKIDCVAGYGIGEYGALCFAGGLNFPDGLYLLKKLAGFYTDLREQLDIKSIAIEGLSQAKLELLCKEISSDDCHANIAIYENKKECLVTGHTEAVEAISQNIIESGVANVSQKDSVEGMHSPLVNELYDQLKIYLTKVDFKDLQIPLFTGVSGKEICKAKKAQDAIMNQIVKPVYWSSVLKQFEKVDVLVIPSPAKNFADEIRAFYPDKQIFAIDTLSDIDQLNQFMQLNNNVESNVNSDNLTNDLAEFRSIENLY